MILLILGVLGLCFGSFVNALVWRLHEKKDWVRARSQCVDCGHELAAKDLIPVFSWLELRGKCRYCKKPIHWQYPVVEAATAGIFIGSYLYWPYGFTRVGIAQFALWLAIMVLLMALLIYDLRWMLLPNKLVYPVLGLAAANTVLLYIANTSISTLLDIALGSLALGGLFWIMFQLSKGKWIGGGDVRLGFGLGALAASPLNAALLLFIASVLGSLAALPMLMKGGKHKLTLKVPFGPFLIVATIIVYIFGASIIAWYEHFIYMGS